MRSIRVTQIDYSPHEYEVRRNRDHPPLKVFIRGVDRYGEFQEVILMGTRPRFWVPYPVNDAYLNGLKKSRYKDILTQQNVTHGIDFDSHSDPEMIDVLFTLKNNLNKANSTVGLDRIEALIKFLKYAKEITEFEGGYKCALTGKPLWCIYVNYPWVIGGLRDIFYLHYQADVVYDEAVRIYYGIEDIITIPDSNVILPHDIQPYEGHSYFPMRDWILDIETGDTDDGSFPDPEKGNVSAPILCFTYMQNREGKPGGKIIHATTSKVDPEVIKAYLADSKWLKENCDTSKIDEDDEEEGGEKKKEVVVAPIDPSTIEIRSFWSSTPHEAEFNLLAWQIELLHGIIKPTHILAYNAEFDSEYRKKRSGQGSGIYKIPFLDQKRNAQVFCMMEGYLKSQENLPESHSLEYISQTELGYGKISRPAITEMARNDPERLSIYNIWDCVLVNRLDNKLNILNAAQSYSDFHLTDIQNYASNTKLVETMLMNFFFKMKEILPSTSCVKEISGEGGIDKGADVMDAPTCIEQDCFELDHGSEYPNIIVTGNIDHKTIIPANVTDEQLIAKKIPFSKFPSGNRYRLDIKGAMPETVKELMVRRKKYKEISDELKVERDKFPLNSISYESLNDKYQVAYNTQFNAKKSTNAWYGLCGTSDPTNDHPFRAAHPGMGSDITRVARGHLKWSKEKVEGCHHIVKEGITLSFKVIYQDTDSNKIVCNEFKQLKKTKIDEIADDLSKYVNSTFGDFAEMEMNVKTHTLSVKVDSIYKSYFQWGVKKRYAYMDKKSKMEFRGVEMRRSSAPKITKKIQKKFFRYVLSSGKIDEKRIHVLISGYIRDIRAGKYDRECGQSLNVNSVGNKYGMKAITYSNEYLHKNFKIGGGKVVIYKVKSIKKNDAVYPKVAAVALEWRDDPNQFGLVIDYDEIIDTFIKSPLMLILEPFGISWDGLLSGTSASRLSDFV